MANFVLGSGDCGENVLCQQNWQLQRRFECNVVLCRTTKLLILLDFASLLCCFTGLDLLIQ